ncbi:AcrR family transcriptional regulator [Allocatelliglobosispora scoriae]|uniref:AcrR family transcriptional regulator n=1 Tax=Allocatelliglobosispora scoriae TaxID=643052 RepID=A0A841BU39_9ACTN|nr:TetR/AcrR family transcriptional regulator [Allocatelliglobosispora scoriae]MBB5870290.1 AcrR family transcriptional regulator [Allocatelliglobosispora scoriae]
MPARGDHDARRRDVSEAVWQVLAAKGFGGLTLRAVATHMGSSTGLLTHYFPSKQALVRHALEIAQQHTAGRERFTSAGEGLPGLRAALLDVMPLTPQSTAMNRVWISFWDAALSDAELAEVELQRYERWRGMLRPHVDAAIRLGQLAGDPDDVDPDDIVATAAGFAHGIVVQAIFDPARFPAQRQIALVDGFIARLQR